MKYYKKIITIFLILITTFSLVGCNNIFKKNTKNILTMGINVELPKNMKLGFSESKVFKYNDTTIPSITIQGVSKKDSILFKSFPFTVEDYKNHFKSAFEGNNIKEIKYDYEEIKGNKEMDKVYKSKAILEVNGKKQYSYVYLISFKNSSGTLIMETTSKSDKSFKDVMKSINKIKANVNNLEFKDYKETNQMTDVKIVEDITIKMPSYFEIKSTYNKNAYYINGFGDNEATYVVASKQKPISTNNLYWNNINGYEVIKKYSDNTYLIHDINTQKPFYLKTEIKEVSSSSGNKYYLRIEHIWR